MNSANVTRLRPKLPPALLLVEDDVVTRVTLADELRSCGFKVLEASNADGAITILETVAVHLVLADIALPGGRSGLDVAEAARLLRPAPHIVLTSGQTEAEHLRRAQELGTFVQKPYSPARVVEVVRRVLDPTC